MDVLKSFNIKSPILLLKTLSSGRLAIIDSQNSLRIIDPATYAVVDGFKSNIRHSRLFGSLVDITPDGAHTISLIPDADKAAVFNVQKRVMLYQIGRHQGEIESVGIDPNSRYCITCGQDGKAFGWVLKSSRLAFSLPPHSDFITTVSFSDNGQWIATGSYDRTVNVLNMSIMKQPVKLRGHAAAVIKIIFLPGAKLLSADKEGNLILWDIRSGKVLKRLPKTTDEITTMVASFDKRFVFVGTKLGYIALYDLKTFEQVRMRYLKESEPVSSLAFLNHPYRLAVGTTEGNVRIYSLFGNEEGYDEMLRNRRYKEFYDAVEANPILMYSKPYETAESIWKDAFEQSRLYLEGNERAKAKELLEPFTGILKKNALIIQLLRDYEKFTLFQTHVEEGRYSLAYSLAKQFPVFHDSDAYRKMEARWRKAFAKAQESILLPNGEEQAKSLLAPYRGISEKTVLIQQLFEERRMYEYFKKIIAQNDFVRFFDLVKHHPFLKEFPEYEATMQYGDRLYIQSHKAYMAGDYATARKACEILKDFPDYANEAIEMENSIRIKHMFYEAIANNNLAGAFSFLSAYPLLYETPEAQVIENQWDHAVDMAQRHASKGEITEVLEAFEPYREIHDKYVAMAHVVAQAYCAKLENLIRLRSDSDRVAQGIRRYVELFGIEERISDVIDSYRRGFRLEMSLETARQGSFETWKPSMMVDDIVAGIV